MYSPDIGDIQTSLRRKNIEKAEDNLQDAQEQQKQDEDIMTLARGFTEGGLGSLGLAEGVRKAGESATKAGKLVKTIAGGIRKGVGAIRTARNTAEEAVDTAKDLASSARSAVSSVAETAQNTASSVSESVSDIATSGGNAIRDAVNPDVVSTLAKGSIRIPQETQDAINQANKEDISTNRLNRIVNNKAGDEKGMYNTEAQDELNRRARTGDEGPEETAPETTAETTAESTAETTAEGAGEGTAEAVGEGAGEIAGDVAEDVAEGVGENVVSTALDSVGGALEGIGAIEDSTGILAPLGVFTQIAGAVSLVGGLAGGAVGFVKDLENAFHLNHSQDEVKNSQNAPVNVAGRFVLPTSNHANLQNLR